MEKKGEGEGGGLLYSQLRKLINVVVTRYSAPFLPVGRTARCRSIGFISDLKNSSTSTSLELPCWDLRARANLLY